MTASNADCPTLYTIGHSNHGWDNFVSIVQSHGITAVADVRSSPYSRFNPQFNRESMAHEFGRAGVSYVFLGVELGARRSEPECYSGQCARYDLIERSPLFQAGLQRLRAGLERHRIALLCAEKDPITCHRMILVCRALRGDAIRIEHILDDGSLESTRDAETRLLAATGMPESDLFLDREALVEEAYRRQGLRIAWTEPDNDETVREASLSGNSKSG